MPAKGRHRTDERIVTMPIKNSFEVLSLKDGRWQTEMVIGDKKEALEEARDILEKRFFSAVKVIEERFDEETGDARHFIVFNEKKTLGRKKKQYTGPERRKGREWRDNPKAYREKMKKQQRRKTTFFAEIIKLILVLGGVLICLIIASIMYVSLGS